MKMLIHTVVIGSLLSLTACGHDQGERVVSGAGIGGGAGGVTALAVGANIIPGVLIGSAIGAVIGGTTDAEDINFESNGAR